MELLIAGIAAVVSAVVGYALGARGGGDPSADGETRAEQRLRAAAEEIAKGRRPAGGEAGSPEALLGQALEQGWAPRDQERQTALREAVGRVSGFLERGVRQPLAGAAADADAAELRERIDRALGALQDLDFFLSEPDPSSEGHNVSMLVQQVAREFASDQDVTLRLGLSEAPARAEVNAGALMDALYLIFHNAARFGEGNRVDVTVSQESGGPRIVVRDRGPGFSDEAFRRAFDPFYSTSPDGLGLGLPHARKLIESMGGAVELRNVPDGGAEVEVRLPGA